MSQAAQFKAQAASYVDEIYGAAFCLQNDCAMAEELTVNAFTRGCQDYADQFGIGNNVDLRACLFRELFRTFLEKNQLIRPAMLPSPQVEHLKI